MTVIVSIKTLSNVNVVLYHIWCNEGRKAAVGIPLAAAAVVVAGAGDVTVVDNKTLFEI